MHLSFLGPLPRAHPSALLVLLVGLCLQMVQVGETTPSGTYPPVSPKQETPSHPCPSRFGQSSTGPNPVRSTRVIIISDPQVINFHSPSARKHPIRSMIDSFIVDTFLKKSWMLAQRFNPDAVFFLGDMMHSGRAATLEGE